MFTIAALIPSPPVLVPELCGGHPTVDPEHLAAKVPALRAAVLTAARTLAREARHWIVIGVISDPEESQAIQGYGPREAMGMSRGVDPDIAEASSATSVLPAVETIDELSGVASGFGADAVGTFRGYGVDVRVALSDSALRGSGAADPELPLSVLVGGWVRGQVAEAVSARAWLVDGGASARQCAELASMLRCELDADPEPGGVLVIADGANTLSRTAPGYLDPRAEGVQDRIDTALDEGDCAVLTSLDTDLCARLGVSGRAAYQVLAGLFGEEAHGAGPDSCATGEVSGGLPAFGAHSVETLYRAAPFGVGYHVSLWRPGART